MNRKRFAGHYLLALLVFNLAACSTMQPVNVESAMRGSAPYGIDYGSLVEVKTFDNQSVKFRVTRINTEGLGGSENFYRYEEMASLKVEQQADNKNTTGILLGLLGVAALVFLVANADSVAVCSPSPCPAPPPE